MGSLIFWKNWTQSDRYFLYFLFSILGLGFGYFVYTVITGIDNIINWEVIQKLDQLKSVAYSFDIANIEFEIPLDNYVVFEYFQGSNLQINLIHAYIYLTGITLAINLIMAILPSLKKFWFYAGMGGFIGFAVLFDVNRVNLFGQSDNSALLILLGLYLAAGYYFREFNPRIQIVWRFVVFCIISILMGLLIYYYAEVDKPFLTIANHGIYAPVIIAILFILSISHEIIYGFLFLVTNSNTPQSRNSLLHFTVISLIYLAYVAVTYMHYIRQLDWNLVYLNPFLILAVSAIIGLWGLRKRDELFSEIFPFHPVGTFFYLCFALISLLVISYIFAMGNDPFIEVFEDAILYGQMGFGIIFFIYILTNFGAMLAKNMRVSKIAYQSRIFPFYVFRIGGVIVVGYIFFTSGFFPYYQSIAGYYNNIGDLYLVENQLDLAREYYERASTFEHQNHRSNYAMATIGRLQDNKFNEAYYFENSLLKRPTEYAYVNLSNVYLQNNQYFEGLFKIDEGLDDFPWSPYLLNNLGYFYSRTDIADSAYYYFNLADNATRNHRVPVTNMYGLLAKSGIYFPPDSLKEIYKLRDYLPAESNQIAILNQFGIDDTIETTMKASEINNTVSFAYHYNAGLNNINTTDTSYFQQIKVAADSSYNLFYINRIEILAALHYYVTHRISRSIGTLYEYATSSRYNVEYYRMLGKLAMDLGSPLLAIEFFEQTNSAKNDKDLFNLSMAMMEAGKLGSAEENFKRLSGSENRDLAYHASEYLEVIHWNPEIVTDTLSDKMKYLLFRYRSDYRSSRSLDEILEGIEYSGIKEKIMLEIIEAELNRDSIEQAETIFDLYQSRFTEMELTEKAREIAYRLDISTNGRTDYIELPGNLPVNDPLFLYDLLLNSIERLNSGDTSGIEEKFRILGTWNPFFENGVIKAAEYYSEIKNDPFHAYNLLVNAASINEYSVTLNKKIIDQAIDINMFNYAIDGLRSLEPLLDEKTFNDYRGSILDKIRERQALNDQWQ